MQVTKLAVLIAGKLAEPPTQVKVELINAVVLNCRINNLSAAIQCIALEFGVHLDPRSIEIMCATLGVESGSALTSVLHVMADAVPVVARCPVCELEMADYAGPAKGERGKVCQTPECEDDADDLLGTFIETTGEGAEQLNELLASSAIANGPSDKEMLDWLEANADLVDFWKSSDDSFKVHVPGNTRGETLSSNTLRQAIALAMAIDFGKVEKDGKEVPNVPAGEQVTGAPETTSTEAVAQGG